MPKSFGRTTPKAKKEPIPYLPPEGKSGDPLPLYPSQLDPSSPLLDHEPAMRWEVAQLENRIAILEAAVFKSDETPGAEGGSTPG